MKSGRHIRAKPRASRLIILARRPFGFTRECETSASREVQDDAILREVEVPFEGSKDVCEVVQIAGDADVSSEAVLQDIMTKYNEMNCADKKTWCGTPISAIIETVELVNLIGQAAQGLYSGEARHESRRAHTHELPGA